ncbi:hypothetical protein [Azospirillum doebereinerae]
MGRAGAGDNMTVVLHLRSAGRGAVGGGVAGRRSACVLCCAPKEHACRLIV